MKKSIALIVFVSSIIVVLCSINTNAQSTALPVIPQSIVFESPAATYVGDVEALPVHKTVQQAKSTVHKPSRKSTPITVAYQHTLEQGGSPKAQTVKVIEYL